MDQVAREYENQGKMGHPLTKGADRSPWTRGSGEECRGCHSLQRGGGIRLVVEVMWVGLR